MKTSRSLGGLLSTLGLRDTAESPDVTIAWAFPIQHLVRHGFPHGCVQIYGSFTSGAAVAEHSFIKVIGGAGNTWLKYVQPPTTANDVIMHTRAVALAETNNTPVAGYAQLPADNGASSGIYTGRITIATLATITQQQRYLLAFTTGVMSTPNPCDVIVPRGQVLYFINPGVNSALTLSIFAWETCPD